MYYKKGSILNMSTQKITNLADKTNPSDAVYFKQFTSLEDNDRAFDDKYIKRAVNMVGGVAVGYVNMMAMLVLNVAPSTDLSSAVNLSQLNNHNTFISHVNLNRNKFNNLQPGQLLTDGVAVEQVQRLMTWIW